MSWQRDGTWFWDPTPLAVSLAGLSYAVISFWWMHWRRGRLTVATPRQFAASLRPHSSILLLPLGLWNNGPVPYLVTDLRLKVSADHRWWTWQRTRTEVQPSNAPTPIMAAPFVVPGRDASVVFAEFQVDPGVSTTTGQWVVEIEARLRAPSWMDAACHTCLAITDKVVGAEGFIAFSNEVE
jgi:hypothetical protein